MPSFDFLDKVELFVRAGRHPVDASKSSKRVTRAASKHFIYKDGCLWRTYRGRFLRVVRSDEEVKEILTRYHDNNNHAGRVRAVREIMLMYYWVGVTEAVKSWIKACAVCQSRSPAKRPDPPVHFCLAYGCDASSCDDPELSFHRFPQEAERRRRWLAAAQRDEGSLRTNSCLCSRHFKPTCFTLSEAGQLTLSPDAVPTVTVPVTAQEDEVPVPSQHPLRPDALGDLLCSSAAVSSEPCCARSDTPAELQEHQYCLPAPDPGATAVQPAGDYKMRRSIVDPSFAVYNQIARFLSHRVLPAQSKKSRGSFKRMAKRFGLIDGDLMYTRVSPPLRVPRSREEVNSILERFHDNRGHYGQGICQREIAKHFYWASMTRDLARWIGGCHTCLNRTKRKWLRCSVHSCTNCCGPVERGLGLTFHRFPLHNAALLAQWLKAVGRPHWHPRLLSSVCSVHFTDDCFDRSGEQVAIRPDAVPTVLVHGDSGAAARGPAQPPVGEEAYFAKYDAVELYLSRRSYPPGLSYVEKNTFRRFCKKFAIKDGELHMVRGDLDRLVLRNRQQVEAALVDYHNELNHLDFSKCHRLLSERFFWKTMRSDVLQWIDSCSQCGGKKEQATRPEAAGPEPLLRPPGPPQIHRGAGSAYSDDDDGDEGGGDDGDEGGGDDGDEERQRATNPEVREPVTPMSPRPRIPILLHLRAPINLQPRTPIILQPGAPNAPFIARLWSVKETNSCGIQPESQSSVQVDRETGVPQGGARTHHCVQTTAEQSPEQSANPKLPQTTSRQSPPASQSRGLGPQSQITPQSHGSIWHPGKRGSDVGAGSSGCGPEPVVAPSTRPWPVFTIAGSARTQTDRRPPGVDSPAHSLRPRGLQARTIIQQCTEAKVKTKPALDGADAQWAEIQQGMVVYVCFFHGASADVTHEMASSLMTTRLFRKDSGRSVSVLDLPGSVLLIPQGSLLGEPAAKRRVQYKGGCEPWRGAQLFSNLASACRKFMSGSAKCTKAGARVEQGVYGQRQEMVLNSVEPLTLLLEF